MSTDTMPGILPVPAVSIAAALSPPDSTKPPHESSDSELSDLEDPEELHIEPSFYDGTVPVFEPTMEEFSDFERYMGAINQYGMKSGIVKVRPPQEWKGALPKYDELIKPIKLRDAIKQDIMGTAGTYRQANIVSMRSYNVPQWRALCEQSDHQPPAKRGERRANQDKNSRTNRPVAKPKSKKDVRRKSRKDGGEEDNGDRLPTPESPNDEDSEHEKKKPQTSVSARRKYNRKEAATAIDEEAFKDFDYELHEEFSRERCEELERAYWKTLTYASPLYGADMVGSLFDESTKAWNLGNLPNLLDILGTKIPGVNTAYLYMGMWKATFAWHLEDVDLYSINYLHFGAPKQWYSISQGDARRFEAAMKSIWPADAKACDQFLRHKTFLISPSTLLKDYGIKVNKIVHHPGEFVITFPYGYHSGYNLGYNCAEAVNFALRSWLDFGRIAKRCDCSEAQDSVWINVSEIDRKLAGLPTDDEMSEEEDSADEDDEPTDLPTPQSGDAAVKIKLKANKRKRTSGDKDLKSDVKRIRIRMKVTNKEPCELCPNDTSSEPLLSTLDGRKVHKICALYIPETEVETVGNREIVLGIDKILKARLNLKCVYCRSKKGACFQCSQGKCFRSYHATCAAAAGVFVEEGETPEFGPDGTEYKTECVEFSCRFHREKRAKKIDHDALDNDTRIMKAALELTVGEKAQFQYLGGDYFAGCVVVNQKSEGILVIDVLPCGGRLEVEYKFLRIPDPADYRMVKPSSNAIPKPKSTMTTTKRLANDLPRKGDAFIPGATWEEFAAFALPRNVAQTKTDLSKDDQLWYYLGKNSTEAKAQYTKSLAKPINNPRAYFLDTIPKPIPASATRPSLSASYPVPKPNQHALNAVRSVPRQPLPGPASKLEKPYAYKPRSSDSAGYRIDPQAYASQQHFLQNSQQPQRPPPPPPHNYGTDPRFARPADYRTASPYSNYPPNPYHSTGNSAGSMGQYYHQKSDSRPPTESRHAFKPLTPAQGSTPQPQIRQLSGSAARSSKVPPVFAKYPYLQKQHNRSPLDYRTPYMQGHGFQNGYEGNLKEHLMRNPGALMNMNMSSKDYPPILPPAKHNSPYAAAAPPIAQLTAQTIKPMITKPTHKSDAGMLTKFTWESKPHSTEARQAKYMEPWEEKNSSHMHPAIRTEYGTMFHQAYQPPQKSDVQHPSLPRGVSATQASPPGVVAQEHSSLPASKTTAAPAERKQSDFPPILPPKYTTQRVSPLPPPSASSQRPLTSSAGSTSASLEPTYAASMSLPAPNPSQQTYALNAAPAVQTSGTSLAAYVTSSKPAHSVPPTTNFAPSPPMYTTPPNPKPLTPFALAYQQSQPYAGHGAVYPHQQYQYQQRAPLQTPSSVGHQQHNQVWEDKPREVIDVPVETSSIIDQMLLNLKRAAGHSNT